MELKTRMDSLKINVKTLHIKTFCERCFKVLSDVKGSVVLRPYPLTCDERNGHSYDWDCYESWLLDNISRWAHDVIDRDGDFQKFEADDAQENEEVEEKVKTLLYKISSHL